VNDLKDLVDLALTDGYGPDPVSAPIPPQT
jgi:hypothetical protein